MLYLTEAQVHELLPMRACIDLVRRAFQEWHDGKAQNQSRRRLALPTGTVLHSLAGACGQYLGTKVYFTNGKHGILEFFFLLSDAETGRALAIMRAEELGGIRTGAASGYAADLLAAPDASVLGVVGSGYQARTQVAAIRAIRPIREVRVWSRRSESREQFAREHGAIAVPAAEAAVRGAHIVITATNAKDPVLEAEWIKPGTFVAAMGSNQAGRRELPAELVRAAGLIAIDSLEQAKIEAGDLILADCWSNVVELKDVTPGYDPARITIFKSLGLGLEDVAAGAYVYEQALQRNIGLALEK
jgi:ornithine cyclodeaminase/alanine dehydrogenase-like protein (mu-crystallin family)